MWLWQTQWAMALPTTRPSTPTCPLSSGIISGKTQFCGALTRINAPKKKTILLAEDNEGLQEAAKEMLEKLGYRVILASNGSEAIQIFTENPGQFDLIILDVVMPKMSGPAAFSQMTAIRADLRVVFSTGYTAEAASLNPLLEQGASILQKPY